MGVSRPIAIKVLPPQFASGDKFARHFAREAKVIAGLEHARILPVYDHGQEDGVAYIVMRYLEAGTLKELMSKGQLPLGDVVELVGQIGAALDYAHRRGVVHRDVKPSNVLVDAEGSAYMTDFGIAKMTEGATEVYTTTGVMGTPAYMSPEQGTGRTVASTVSRWEGLGATGGCSRKLENASGSYSANLKEGNWYTVRVEAYGNMFSVYLDDQLMLQI